MTRGCGSALLVIALAAGLPLRFARLDARPMHHDEANQAVKFGALLERGEYRYDARDHHGPTLYYLTLLAAWLRGQTTLASLDEWTLRGVTAVFGLATVLLLPLLSPAIGRTAVAAGALLMALSPAMVFFSRMFIQESLFAGFALAFVIALGRVVGGGGLRWAAAAGVAAGLAVATKETAVIVLPAALVACALASHFRGGGASAPPVKGPWAGSVFTGLLSAAAVALLFYSSFFTYPAGLLEPFRGARIYVDRGMFPVSHGHPWHYYLQLLTYSRSGGLWWSEGVVVVLAAVGGVLAWWPGGTAKTAPPLVRFLGTLSDRLRRRSRRRSSRRFPIRHPGTSCRFTLARSCLPGSDSRDSCRRSPLARSPRWSRSCASRPRSIWDARRGARRSPTRRIRAIPTSTRRPCRTRFEWRLASASSPPCIPRRSTCRYRSSRRRTSSGRCPGICGRCRMSGTGRLRAIRSRCRRRSSWRRPRTRGRPRCARRSLRLGILRAPARSAPGPLRRPRVVGALPRQSGGGVERRLGALRRRFHCGTVADGERTVTPPQLALVVPCHNEASRLDPEPPSCGSRRRHPDVRLVLVDDGSIDGTGEILERMRAAAPDVVRTVALSPRRGKARGGAYRHPRRPRAAPAAGRVLRRGPVDAARRDRRFSDCARGCGPTVEFVLGSRVMLMGRDVRRKATSPLPRPRIRHGGVARPRPARVRHPVWR